MGSLLEEIILGLGKPLVIPGEEIKHFLKLGGCWDGENEETLVA